MSIFLSKMRKMSKSRARASSSPAGMRVPNPRGVFIGVGGRAARPRAENFLREAGGRRRRSVLCLSVSNETPLFAGKSRVFALKSNSFLCHGRRFREFGASERSFEERGFSWLKCVLGRADWASYRARMAILRNRNLLAVCHQNQQKQGGVPPAQQRAERPEHPVSIFLSRMRKNEQKSGSSLELPRGDAGSEPARTVHWSGGARSPPTG